MNLVNSQLTPFNPLVSIIIPVYNGSNYLSEAIDSALSQTYQNIEIIVINDGSNDNGKTEQIALSYDNKIKYIAKQNGGVATALNMGIEHMKGEYFSWLSHDDVYYERKIQNQIEYLVSNGDKDTIVYSDFETIDAHSKIIKKSIPDHDILTEEPLYTILKTKIHGCSLLIPKKAFDKYGVFNTTLKFTQDYDLWIRLNKHYNFKYLAQTLIQSRSHEQQDSKTHSQNPEEGNSFWCKCLDELTDEDILKCEKTKTLFYLKIAAYLKFKPYNKAYLYSKKLAYTESPLFSRLVFPYILITHFSKKSYRFILRKLSLWF